MTRILVLGAAPLPIEPRDRQYAANLRTWHFTEPLVGDGHEVYLVAGRLPRTYPADTPKEIRQSDGGFEYYSVAEELFHDDAYIQRLHDELEPEAIVGVNTYPASRAVRIETDRPIWCDLNGWVMAEAQTKTHVYDDDSYLSHFWNMERQILDRADVISTVSEAQLHATIGELAVRGRLGRKNFGYDFVHRIPNALSEADYTPGRRVARGIVTAEDAFIVLWVGGYNTWTDVDLLYEALSRAMNEVPELHFVSTGGVIEGHDEITFARFQESIAQSPHADRFHLAGWVPTADVPSYYAESDLGINVDSQNYETVFGARNRLNDMLKVALPILTTRGTEISRILADEELALSASIGDAAAFAERLVWAARHREELRAMGRAARDFASEEFSYAKTTRPLRAWVENPRRAPDLGERIHFTDVDYFRAGAAPTEEAEDEDPQERLEQLGAELDETRRQLREIHASRMWHWWMRSIRLRRGLARLLGRGGD